MITGRVKELIITAGGENIAPIPIEHRFLSLCPIASNIVVVGDDQKFLTALVTLKTDMKDPFSEPTTRLSEEV